MNQLPDACFIDLAHRVPQYDLQQAAYLLLSAYKYFPAGTVHLLLVDIFAGEQPRMLLSEKDGFYFIVFLNIELNGDDFHSIFGRELFGKRV